MTLKHAEKVDLKTLEPYVPANTVTCPKCGYRWLYKGAGRGFCCNNCSWTAHSRESQYESRAKYKATEKGIKNIGRQVKEYRETQLAKGLCKNGCGNELSSKTLCRKCLLRLVQYKQRKKAEKQQ